MAGTLKEKIYSTIMEQIMTGRISPDEFLTEARLAEQFQASRAPVREALVALCNECILRNIPRVGYRLVTISRKDVSEALAVRVLLESEAACLALRNLDPGKERALDQLIREEEESRAQRFIHHRVDEARRGGAPGASPVLRQPHIGRADP